VKTKVEAACQSCGARMPRWVGRCPECDEWGTVVEEPTHSPARSAANVNVESLAAHDPLAGARLATGIDEADLVLGGGAVAGSIVLLAGEPGVGKSTLALQIALALGAERDVLLVCGEEAPSQIRARAARLGSIPDGVRTMADPQLGAVLQALDDARPSVLIVDSIQTMFDPDIPSAPGSVSQVRECGARLAREARDRGVTVLLVGHVTKEGAVAGPRVLEHLVDVVLHFEGDRSGGVRVLRALKNRFGSTQEVGFFEMAPEGLVPIRDASAYLLADRCGDVPGSVLAASVDGRRPFVCEIQALVTDPSGQQFPRRTSIGVDGSRLPMLIGVLEQRAEISFANRDVYVSAVGGIRAMEPACDLPIALALMSALLKVVVPADVVAFGEIGLSGELRQVLASDRRIAEARSVGCKRVFVPHNCTTSTNGLELVRVRHVSDALVRIRNAW
jgi:DNA repair protein RadA/Sms